jgi:hypothetical protein
VFEDASRPLEEGREASRAVRVEAGGEDQVVAPGDDVDGVELYEAEMLDEPVERGRAGRAARLSEEALRVEEDPALVGEVEDGAGGIRHPRRIAVEAPGRERASNAAQRPV